jgi:hypothetical protein
VPNTSTSTGGEGGSFAKEDKAEPALKKNKDPEIATQGEKEEKRKKKKHEDPRPKAIVREK